jgi:membrane-associated protease RseP (regulator of RpoE activity)
MSQNPGMPLNSELEPVVTPCANCHSPMPSGLRFCRNCGYRLGEGPAEYTETVRFQNGHPGMSVGVKSTADQQSVVTSYGLSSGSIAPQAGGTVQRACRKTSGMTWIFLGLLGFFLIAGVFTALFSPARRSFSEVGISAPPPAPRSYVGVSGFESTDGGVTFDNVEPADSPADRAHLVGGDVITTFDGKKVDDEDVMTELLRSTPVGKTVDVVYIRDGETRTTKLTTVSKEEFDRLGAVLRKRTEGLGQFGYDTGDAKRVAIPGTKIFGVQLGEIRTSRPADLAGIKEGDIVTQFGDTPIRTPEELEARVGRALPYTTVEVVVMRGTEELKIPVKMGKQ